MVDPAVTGLIGTAIGGFIGFAGTALTSWRTTKREKQSRLFTERKKTYAAFLRELSILDATAQEKIIDRNKAAQAEWQSMSDATRLLSDNLLSSYSETGMVCTRRSYLAVRHCFEEATSLEATLYDLLSDMRPVAGNTERLQKFDSQMRKFTDARGDVLNALRRDLGIRF